MAINTTIPNIIGGEIRALPLNQDLNWTLNNLVDLQAQISANDVDIANRYTKSEVDSKDTNLQSQVTVNKNTMDNHIASTTAHDANNIILTSEDPYLTANNVESGLEQVSARVSAIIAQSGTSSTEVVDARTSSTYGVFTTLGNRLNSSDIKLKALEDEVETQNVGTLALTPTTSNQSPTDSYSGIVDAEIGGATLYQALTNKLSGWTGINGGITTVGEVLKLTASNSGATSRMEKSFAFKSSNRYFLKAAKVRVTNANCLKLTLSTNLITGFSINNPVQNQWYTLFLLRDATTDDVIRVWHEYADVGTANGKVLEIDFEIEEGGVFAIPLTGTPYESMTADQINAMIPTYFEGLNSTTEVEINTSGVNLFDGDFVNGIYKEQLFNALYDYLEIKVKPNTQHSLSFDVSNTTLGDSVYLVDGVGNFTTFTTGTLGAKSGYRTSLADGILYIAVRRSIPKTNYETLLTRWIINESSTALPYQPHKPSQLSVKCTNPAKFELSKLPNGVQNEVNQVKGFPSAVKRNERYALKSTDIYSFATESVNFDYVQAYKVNLVGSAPWVYGIIGGKVHLAGFSESVINAGDIPSRVNTISLTETALYIIIPKGKYANLAAAQAGLAGTEVIYQLATPVFIPYEDFNDYGIECQGALVSHDDYTNINYTANLVPNVSLEYSRNLSACVDGLTQAMGNIYDITTQINLDLETKKQKNYIINGGFDIWQRALTQTSSGYGSDDRWFNGNIGSTKTHSVQGFTIGQADVPNNPLYFSRTVVISGNTVASIAYKLQRIEDVTKLSGKTLSLTFWAKADSNKKMSIEFSQNFGSGGSVTSNSISIKKVDLTSTWTKFTVDCNFPSVFGKTIGVGSFSQCVFWFDAGSDSNSRTDNLGNQSGTFDISSVCLVEGSNPQDYQSENVDDTKRQCERYLKNLSGMYRMAYFNVDSLSFGLPSLSNEMRSIPTLYSFGATEGINYQIYPINASSIPNGFILSLLLGNEIKATKIAHGMIDGLLVISSKVFADAEL